MAAAAAAAAAAAERVGADNAAAAVETVSVGFCACSPVCQSASSAEGERGREGDTSLRPEAKERDSSFVFPRAFFSRSTTSRYGIRQGHCFPCRIREKTNPLSLLIMDRNFFFEVPKKCKKGILESPSPPRPCFRPSLTPAPPSFSRCKR